MEQKIHEKNDKMWLKQGSQKENKKHYEEVTKSPQKSYKNRREWTKFINEGEHKKWQKNTIQKEKNQKSSQKGDSEKLFKNDKRRSQELQLTQGNIRKLSQK